GRAGTGCLDEVRPRCEPSGSTAWWNWSGAFSSSWLETGRELDGMATRWGQGGRLGGSQSATVCTSVISWYRSHAVANRHRADRLWLIRLWRGAPCQSRPPG